MNKQELIEALKEEYNDYHPEYNYDIRLGFEGAIEMVEELLVTEAEPLVVPKYLGEWLAKQSLGNEKNLFGIIGGLEDMWVRGDFEEFIDTNKKELIEVILGTKPYEVEKEKLYYVLDKQGKTLLVLVGGEVCISGGYVLSESTASKGIYQLTEKQIKDYDERFWEFALEVAE